MDCDVAVLGGGPGGYTAAIRAAQLGAKDGVHREGAGARRDVPARRLHPHEGVGADRARHPRGARELRQVRRPGRASRSSTWRGERVEGRRLQADDVGRGVPVQGERRRVGQGHRPLQGREHDRGRGRGGRDVQERDHRHRLVPAAAADPGARLADVRRLDRAARPDRGAGAARRPRRRDHRLRVRLDLPALRLRGDDRRDAADADPAGGRGRDQGARQAVQEARHRAPARQAVHAGRRPRHAPDRPLRRRRDGRRRPDARLRRPRPGRRRASASRRSASSSTRARASPPTSTGARPSRTSTPSATAPATGSSRTRPSARARSRPRTRWATTP